MVGLLAAVVNTTLCVCVCVCGFSDAKIYYMVIHINRHPGIPNQAKRAAGPIQSCYFTSPDQ